MTYLKKFPGQARPFGVEENPEAVAVPLARLQTSAWQRFAAQRDPLTGAFADQLLRIGLADEVDGAVLPRRAGVLLFADEPGSLLAAFDSRADIRVMVFDGKHALAGATPNLREFPDLPNIDAGEGVPMMFAEMAQAELYPPQYGQNTDAAVESVTVSLFNLTRPSAWDEVSDWIDREGAIANADVVRIAGVDTLKASKMLTGWHEQGLLVALPGRAKRNMAYTKPSAADQPVSLLSPLEDNNGGSS